MDNLFPSVDEISSRSREALERPVSRSATRHHSSEAIRLGALRDYSSSEAPYVCEAAVRPRPHQLARRLSAYECQPVYPSHVLPVLAQTTPGGDVNQLGGSSHQPATSTAPVLPRHGGGRSAALQLCRSQQRDAAAAAAATLSLRSHSMLAASQHPFQFSSIHGATATGDSLFSTPTAHGSSSRRNIHVIAHREPSYLAMGGNGPAGHQASAVNGLVTSTAAAGAHNGSVHGPGGKVVTAAAAAAASTALRKSHCFQPLSISAPHHSCFHLAWIGGCTVYVAAFAPAALLPVIRPELHLSLGQAGAAAVAALVASVFTRFLMAVLVRRYGPRYCQVMTLLYTGPVLACMTLVTGSAGFVLMRFLLGASLGLFVVAQCWVVAMFDWSVLRTAVNFAAGLVSAGGGLVMLIVPLLYIGVRPLYGGSNEAAWRATFHILAAACIVIAILTLMFGQDTPTGDLLDPKPALPAGYQVPYRAREKQQEAVRRYHAPSYGPVPTSQAAYQPVVSGPQATAEGRMSPVDLSAYQQCNERDSDYAGRHRRQGQPREPQRLRRQSVTQQQRELHQLRQQSLTQQQPLRQQLLQSQQVLQLQQMLQSHDARQLHQQQQSQQQQSQPQHTQQQPQRPHNGTQPQARQSQPYLQQPYSQYGNAGEGVVEDSTCALARSEQSPPVGRPVAASAEPSLLRRSIAAAAAAAASNQMEKEGADPALREPLVTSGSDYNTVGSGGPTGASPRAGAGFAGVSGARAAGTGGRASGDMERSSARSSGSLRSSDSGTSQRMEEHVHLYAIVLRNPICWILALNNGFTFGVQLVVFNVLPIYLTDVYDMGVVRAGCAACVFGLTNIATRVSGCQLSDALSRRYGMRGRLWLIWALQASGGVFCALLGTAAHRSFAGAAVLLILFAISIQLACGVMFSITPFVSYRGYAVVAAAVAAGGQVGAAVLQGAFFTKEGFSFNRGFEFMGVASVVASASLLLLRFPMWGGMLSGPSDPDAGDDWAEERYYAREWSEMERSQGLAEAAAGFAWLAKAERTPKSVRRAAPAAAFGP